MTGKVHIIGAGIAGLSAAVALAKAGVAVEVSEAAAQAGGRCRSYFDPQLGAVIDNGNHFVFSGNTAVHELLHEIGALDRLRGPKQAEYAFFDKSDGARWMLRPNDSALAWWIASPQRRTPDTRVLDHLKLFSLLFAKPDQRVGDIVPTVGPLWRGLVEPVLVGALNTPAADCSARLAGAVIRETLAKGGRAYTPRSPDPTLSAAFIDPALDRLRSQGGQLTLSKRLKAISFSDDRAISLVFSDEEASLAAEDRVVLATPPWVAQDLLPGLAAPDEFNAIVNGHFLTPGPKGAPLMQGVLGGTAHWVFGFEDRISTTTSAANDIVDLDRETLAARLWADVLAAYRLSPQTPRPPWQIVKEKRATFAATVEQDQKRPPAQTRWRNLILAGDWTQTGLPATIEGAIRSGFHAAELAMRPMIG